MTAATRYWHKLDDDRIQCDLCPRFCKLRDGQRGLCFVRACEGNEVVLTTYGRSSGFCVDPIEKKPLNHFLPGTPVLSFGTAGCNLTCKFCQNYDISKSREFDKLAEQASPEMIAAAAVQAGARSVAFTYNDPVIFLEYAVDTAIACHERGLKTVAVTAGYICPEPRAEFFSHIDAANIDLKGFTEEFYHELCVGSLAPVLETLIYLQRETDVWFEITTLLIPGKNDGDDELKRLAEKQQQLVMSLSNMLESMLDVSKLEAGTVQAAPQVFLLDTLFRALNNALEPVATREGVKLRFVASGIAVKCDPFLLNRITANLVINAINASPDGHVLVGVRVGQKNIRLQVLDNGAGIPLEAQGRIFEQFVQVQDDSRPAPTGLGLGLSIVTNLCHLMDLDVSLASIPDRGTVMTVTIPRVDPNLIEQSEPAISVDPDSPPDSAASDGTALPRLVILAVDNDPPVLDAMTEILRQWGHSAMGAGSAHEAVRLLDELGEPDLLLCDYRLEGRQTGFEVIAQVRSYFGREIPAAIITGATSAEDLRTLNNSGLPILHKPINFPRMIDVLKDAASRKQAQP